MDDHSDLGRVVLPHSPFVFEGTIEPSLPLGAKNGVVFGDWLKHSEDEPTAYQAEGVIERAGRRRAGTLAASRSV